MLLDEFSVIFDRPEKIKKLREYILSLAVRGKLVPQDENDKPASVLLEKIREEKKRLVKDKKIKKEKSLPQISEDEIPYELPKGWEWVRLGEVCKLYNGYAFKSKDYIEKGMPIIRISDVYSEITDLSNCMRVSEDLYDERYVIKKGDFLIAMSGGTTGKYGIYNSDEIALQNQRVGNIKSLYSELVYDEYKNYFIIANRSKILKLAYGGAQPNISNAIIDNLEFSLPPLNEQKRIVEKLDYLMDFCDKLESHLEKKVKLGSLSTRSVLNGVSNCSSYEELEESLRFIIENFKDLTLADGAVGELKNAILSLAVKGKLVPQDEGDEPASALLERIREEKDSLVKEKKIKKENPLPEISEDEIPYELPKGWEWIRMREVAQNIHYGYTASAKTDNTGVKFVRITDIQNNMVNWETVPYCDIDDKKLESCKLENNDILIARTGGTIGKSFIVENVEYSAVFASYLIRVIPLKSINPRYLKLFLETPLYWRQLISKSQGTGQPNVNSVSLSELVMPLPSINEQERIIDRVEKLMKVCDELELRIEKSKKYSGKLMESILKNSFKA